MHLVTNITSKGDDPALVRAFLAHYRASGVRTFHVFFNHYEDEEARLPLYHGLLRAPDVHIAAQYLGVEDMQERVDKISRYRQEELRSEDFVIGVDVDELVCAPLQIASILKEQRCDYVQGRMVDRFGVDGTTPEIPAPGALFRTFPICSHFSRDALHALDTKVPIARPFVRFHIGLHSIEEASELRRPVWEVPVHHFKWTSGIVERIRQRVARRYGGDKYLEECAFFLEECVTGDGRIDLSDVYTWFDAGVPLGTSP